MAKEAAFIDIREVPALLRVAEEVRASGHPQVLRADSADVAVEIRVAPKAARARRRRPAGRPLTYDDPLWQLVGAAADAAPTDAARKHEYLAEAYAPKTP